MEKYILLVTIFHLLKHERLMIEFESMQGLFEILKVDKMPYKHWSDYNEWEMENCMPNVVLVTRWHVIQTSHLIH